jgi:hypothetical protein
MGSGDCWRRPIGPSADDQLFLEGSYAGVWGKIPGLIVGGRDTGVVRTGTGCRMGGG